MVNSVGSQIGALIIQVIHFLFILFVLFGILSNDPLILLFYLCTLVSLQLHWFMNNDICCLTITERILTGRSNDESFMHRLVSPVYKIPDKQLAWVSKVVVCFMIILTLIKFWRLGITPRKIYGIIKDAMSQATHDLTA